MSFCFAGYPQAPEIISLLKAVPDMVANGPSRVGNRPFHSFSALPSLRRGASAAVGHRLETEDRGARLDLVEDHRARPRGRGRAEGRVARILEARLGERAEHSRSGGDVLDVVATCNLGCRGGANAQGRWLGAGEKEGGKNRAVRYIGGPRGLFSGFASASGQSGSGARDPLLAAEHRRTPAMSPSRRRRTGAVKAHASGRGGRPRRTKGQGARCLAPPPGVPSRESIFAPSEALWPARR